MKFPASTGKPLVYLTRIHTLHNTIFYNYNTNLNKIPVNIYIYQITSEQKGYIIEE